jgi:hypothetical protein
MASRIYSRILIVVCLFLVLPGVRATGEEIFRIRVTNEAGGPVEVSVDGGAAYATVGRVTKPALSAIASFGAAAYVPAGSVAATAIHGIRIKTVQMADGASRAPMTISIVPREFSRIPKGFGGHEASSSGMYTDIPSGTSIFRTFAPFVGSPVYLQQNSQLRQITPEYTPLAGDVFVIVVDKPASWPLSIEFENRVGGAVTEVYPDGSKEEITKVVSPVTGVGRFDGTSYTGVGCINTNHGGVITVSTAPISDSSLLEGDGPERRGGFEIQPSYHSTTQPYQMPQAMVVGPEDAKSPAFEGKPPLFFGHLGLIYDPSDLANSFRVQIKVDGGQWEPMPTIAGKVDDAFLAGGMTAYCLQHGQKRSVKTGVTDIRIVFPKLDHSFLVSQLSKCKAVYSSASAAAGTKVVSGTLTINVVLKDSVGASYVTVLVDGQTMAITNSAPYAYDWDTCTSTDGVHTIEVRGQDDSGSVISRKATQVVVKNTKS